MYVNKLTWDAFRGKTYTLFQNGRHLSILLFPCKLALVASFLNSKFKRRANLQVNKRILKLRPFWNKVYVSSIPVEKRKQRTNVTAILKKTGLNV